MMRSIVVVGSIVAMLSAASANPVLCIKTVKPVCALTKDGKRASYNNECEAIKAGGSILHDGRCEVATFCMDVVLPVCAIDLKTKKEKSYSNACFAEMANAKFVHPGPCIIE